MKKTSQPVITHAKQNGKIVSINEVMNGLSCNCKCTKCDGILYARNNEENVRASHFVHYEKTKCKGESHTHYLSKKIIEKKKYLWLPIDINRTYYEDGTVNKSSFKYEPKKQYFSKNYVIQKSSENEIQRKVLKLLYLNRVEVEKNIDGSDYIADLICYHDSGKRFMVEIVVTNAPNENKSSFLIANEINTLIISLKLNSYKNKNFEKMVLCSSDREWLYNKKLKVGFKYGKHRGEVRHELPSGKKVFLDGWVNDSSS